MRRTVFFLFAVGILTGAVTAQAQGILGEKYVMAEAGYVKYGSEAAKEASLTALGIGGSACYPVTKHIDVSVGYALTDLIGEIPDVPFRDEAAAFELDVTGHSIGVGVLAHLSPENQADLFLSASAIGGIVSSGDLTLHPLSVVITFGAELRSNSPLSVRPYLSYITTDPNIGGNIDFEQVHDAEVGFDASWWLYSHMFLDIATSVAFEDKDVSAFGGVGFSL